MHLGNLSGRRRRHTAAGWVVGPTTTRRARALAAAVLALALASCGGGSGGSGGDEPTTATGRFGRLHTGVCAAAQFAEAGDDARAKESFDDAHFGLHALVQAVEQEDRPTAARLLEAIEAAETKPSTATLEALTERVAESIERTGGTAPDTCP